MAMPKISNTTPVARLSTIGLALLANFAAILAHKRVERTQNKSAHRSGIPEMAKCPKAPVKAVKVIIKTLVPTAVLSSYPNTEVRISSIIIPPPAPTKPQIKPIIIPQTMDWIKRFLGLAAAIFSLVVITGFTMNFIPNIIVINTEKPPIAVVGTRLEM